MNEDRKEIGLAAAIKNCSDKFRNLTEFGML